VNAIHAWIILRLIERMNDGGIFYQLSTNLSWLIRARMDIVVDDFQERSQELIGGHLINSRSLQF